MKSKGLCLILAVILFTLFAAQLASTGELHPIKIQVAADVNVDIRGCSPTGCLIYFEQVELAEDDIVIRHTLPRRVIK